MTKAFRYTSSRTGKKSDVQRDFDKFVGRKILLMLVLVVLAVFLVGKRNLCPEITVLRCMTIIRGFCPPISV